METSGLRKGRASQAECAGNGNTISINNPTKPPLVSTRAYQMAKINDCQQVVRSQIRGTPSWRHNNVGLRLHITKALDLHLPHVHAKRRIAGLPRSALNAEPSNQK
jgi:hypothetical protein